jgi:hypothetical protein
VTILLRLLAFVAIALLIVSGAEADDVQQTGCLATDLYGHCLIPVSREIERKATRCISHDDIVANGLTAKTGCGSPVFDATGDPAPKIDTSPAIIDTQPSDTRPALTCDPGWALLQYPDTPVKVCAREMRAPK